MHNIILVHSLQAHACDTLTTDVPRVGKDYCLYLDCRKIEFAFPYCIVACETKENKYSCISIFCS